MNDWPEFFRRLHEATAAGESARRDLENRLGRARAFIDRAFDESVDLEAMARQAAFSRYHFARAFRRAYGVTPHQYLVDRRLERARELLLTTDRSVTEVCFEVGFSSLGSFSTLFRRRIGQSPERYRRRFVTVPEALVLPVPACFLAVFSPAGSAALRAPLA